MVDLYEIHGKDYAVKLTRDGDLSATFLREVSVMRRLKHPNVCPLLDAGVTQLGPPPPSEYQWWSTDKIRQELARRGISSKGRKAEVYDRLISSDLQGGGKRSVFYMTLPLATGGSLRSRMKASEQLTSGQRQSYAYQLLLGMNYLLSRNILHRDLKPDNLLITADGTLQIADFGLARALTCVAGTGLTHEVVTLWYRPPEILLGGTYHEAADKWSVGCILYELFSPKHQVLFPGDSEIDQLYRIFRVLGTPTKEIFGSYPEWQDSFPLWTETWFLPFGPPEQQLVKKLLVYQQSERAAYRDLVHSPYFSNILIGSDLAPFYNCLDNLDMRCFPVAELKETGLSSMETYIPYQIWLLRVCKEFDQGQRTRFYATNILRAAWGALTQDATGLLTLGDYSFKEIGLVPLACVYLSSMYNEIYGLTSADLVEYVKTSALITEPELQKMSLTIVRMMQFDMLGASCYDYYSEYVMFYPQEIRGLRYLQCLTLMDLYKLPPKQLALVALLGGCVSMKLAFKHPLADLIGPYNEMLAQLIKDQDGNFTAIMKIFDLDLKEEIVKLQYPILAA